ncbi:Gfo/Idh/MocA family protein [Haloarchaeobius sp. DFWS5]|uniref:Gfo/Idh/MocA family protein n=1 Tax=Haloarchaeobius sp. DFWS5 TaxID=3446114 RepID=UPI003EBABB24
MPTVALVGAGFMARTHLERYAEMDVDVVAVASRTGPSDFVDEFDLDAETFTDFETLCRATDPDFVDICTPTDTHRSLVETAAAAGCDVFLEKPIAGSLADAEAIADAISTSGVTCMVGHVLRFFPAYRTARDRVEDGGIGTHGVARARRLSPFPEWGSDDWYADRDRSGGLFLDLAIHDLDYLRWVFGDVSRVFARQRRRERQEHGVVTLRFESGAVGYVEASWAQPESRTLTSELELAGDDGLIELDSSAAPLREFHDDESSVQNTMARDGYRRQLDHFVECLEHGVEPTVTVADATAALRLSLAAEQSAASGRPVDPAEVEP